MPPRDGSGQSRSSSRRSSAKQHRDRGHGHGHEQKQGIAVQPPAQPDFDAPSGSHAPHITHPGTSAGAEARAEAGTPGRKTRRAQTSKDATFKVPRPKSSVGKRVSSVVNTPPEVIIVSCSQDIPAPDGVPRSLDTYDPTAEPVDTQATVDGCLSPQVS